MSVPEAPGDRPQGRLEWQTLLLIAGVIAVGLVTTVAVAALKASGTSDEDRQRFGLVRQATRDTVRGLVDAETGQRGYLLTGDAAFLTPYRDAIVKLDTSFAGMTAGLDGDYHGEMVELRALIGEIRAEFAETLTRYDAGDRDGALAIVKQQAAKLRMDRVRSLSDDIIARETTKIDRARTRARRLRDFAVTVIIVGCSVSALALVVGLLAQRHRNRERARAHAVMASQVKLLEEQGRELKSGVLALASANDALASANDALSRSNRDLDQFAYVASHDLKAPLRGIASLAAWIEDDLPTPVDGKVREHLALMKSRVDRMDSLIAGILAYSRAGKQRGEIAPVDVKALVEESKDLLQLPEGVTFAINDGPWTVLHTDAAPLQQVWLNLLGNAVKHGVGERGTGTVEAGCRLVGGERQYYVKDDGCGIESKYHERIFEIFQRLASRDQIEGAGIGLSVVRKLVESHGGRVWIDSAPGRGTTMFFTWSDRT